MPTIEKIARIDYDKTQGAILDVHPDIPYERDEKEGKKVIGKRVIGQELFNEIVEKSWPVDLPKDVRARGYDVMLIRPTGDTEQYWLGKYADHKDPVTVEPPIYEKGPTDLSTVCPKCGGTKSPQAQQCMECFSKGRFKK